ncbi:MAG: hypothetical protein ACRDKH_07995, partial [Solirubrobacterales bacterium]
MAKRAPAKGTKKKGAAKGAAKGRGKKRASMREGPLADLFRSTDESVSPDEVKVTATSESRASRVEVAVAEDEVDETTGGDSATREVEEIQIERVEAIEAQEAAEAPDPEPTDP